MLFNIPAFTYIKLTTEAKEALEQVGWVDGKPFTDEQKTIPKQVENEPGMWLVPISIELKVVLELQKRMEGYESVSEMLVERAIEYIAKKGN